MAVVAAVVQILLRSTRKSLVWKREETQNAQGLKSGR